MTISRATRNIVRERANRRCEYCQLHERDLPVFPFHVEHIIAIKHGGFDDDTNLAWACHHCNLCKASNLSGVDPDSGRIVRLFHPRQQKWSRHFQWKKGRIVGRTAIGRATVQVLRINAEQRVELRTLLIAAGEFPPE